MGTGCFAFLGVLFIGVAAEIEADRAFARLSFFALSAIALYVAWISWKATDTSVQLTDRGLYDASGRPIAEMSEIASVSRGAFAFKPSHGFRLELSRKAPFGWVPGLWWRFGRHVGVGGVSGSAQTRLMAETIEARLHSAKRSMPR